MKLVVRAVVVLTFIAACVDGGSEEELLVSAAASLGDAFASIEKAFEEANPGVDVVLNLGGSSTLRQQILEGAPVDIFASADRSNIDEVVAAGEVDGEPRVLALNSLQIAVPSGNPRGIDGLGDFADESLLLGLCAETVPCGQYARQVLNGAGVGAEVDTNEPDVRSLLTKIESGELDAGIAYVTDLVSRDDVEGVDIPDELNVVAEYPIVVLADASDVETAHAFIDFVLSAEGQAILNDIGFTSP